MTLPASVFQYFLYEVSSEGEVAVRPRHVLPFALVAFSYVDTAPCTSTLPENRCVESSFHTDILWVSLL